MLMAKLEFDKTYSVPLLRNYLPSIPVRMAIFMTVISWIGIGAYFYFR
jgi:hypothetical protein